MTNIPQAHVRTELNEIGEVVMTDDQFAVTCAAHGAAERTSGTSPEVPSEVAEEFEGIRGMILMSQQHHASLFALKQSRPTLIPSRMAA